MGGLVLKYRLPRTDEKLLAFIERVGYAAHCWKQASRFSAKNIRHIEQKGYGSRLLEGSAHFLGKSGRGGQRGMRIPRSLRLELHLSNLYGAVETFEPKSSYTPPEYATAVAIDAGGGKVCVSGTSTTDALEKIVDACLDLDIEIKFLSVQSHDTAIRKELTKNISLQ